MFIEVVGHLPLLKIFICRWQPFRRSAYNRDKQTTSRKKRIPQPEDRKFFGALIKPKVNTGYIMAVERILEMLP